MLSEEVTIMVGKMQEYFAKQPILRAWLFGSCSRGEESNDSDVDLLVSFDEKQNVSLFTMGGIYMDLKELLKREIDLVEEGTLLPFAQKTAEKDKILIYERS